MPRRVTDGRNPPPSTVREDARGHRAGVRRRIADLPGARRPREPADASSEDLGRRARYIGRPLHWPVDRDGGGDAGDPQGGGCLRAGRPELSRRAGRPGDRRLPGPRRAHDRPGSCSMAGSRWPGRPGRRRDRTAGASQESGESGDCPATGAEPGVCHLHFGLDRSSRRA